MTAPDDEQPPPGFERGPGGRLYMIGPKGELIPEQLVKPKDKLADETVRSLFVQAEATAAALKAFKEKVFEDVDAYCQLVFERYGADAAGAKGNMTIFTFDGLMKVVVQVANRLAFGDEIHAAKALVDECLAEWTADSRPELQAVIANAFRTDSEGMFNRYAILGLQKLDIADERWVRAMQAISDSQKVVGSARYVRFYRKAAGEDRWDNLDLNMATI